MAEAVQLNDRCCLRCEHLIWWDGDYVCAKFLKIISEQTDWATCFPTDIKSITKHREECFKNDDNHIWDKLIEEIKNTPNEDNTVSTLA